ncbi:MAG TPA: hypothetical protein DDZ79_11215 [Aequorivita sp.]|nr:hypothetical protein [Aequorivita sp.]
MTLDGDNYFQLDWTKPNYAGHIIKYNSKYLSIKRDKILIFNDNNFVNPTEFLATTENFSYLTINGAKVFNNDLYLFGNRTIENAYDYFSLIGRYDLNHIIN